MDVLDVPGQDEVEAAIDDHHDKNKLQVELVTLPRRLSQVTPLYPDPVHFVIQEILGAKAHC